MHQSSPIASLTDIVEAIQIIRLQMSGVTLAAFEADKPKRWVVERGIEIISEASRHLSQELKGRHPDNPWSKVAGIGNVLRHDYQDVAHDGLWHVVHENLPALDKACRDEPAREQAQ